MQKVVDKVSLAIDSLLEGGAPASGIDPKRNLERLQSIVRFSALSTSIYFVAVPYYLGKTLGASALETGLNVAIGELATAAARPLIGRYIDRFGRRPFLRIGILIVALSMLMFALARPFTIGDPLNPILRTDIFFAEIMIFLARLVHGLGMGTVLLSSYTITADLAKDAGRGASFGSTEQAQFRGGLYGALLALPILFVNGFNDVNELTITPQVWSTAYAIYAAGAFAAFFMTYRDLPETRELAFVDRSSDDSQSISDEERKRALRIDPQLYVLMAIVFFTNFSDGLKIFILRYIQDHITANLLWIGLAYIPSAIIWGTLPARMGIFADKYGRKPPMSIGLTVSGLFSLTIPALAFIFPNPVIAIIALTTFAALEAVCYSAAVPAEQALVADMMGGEKRGTGFGLFTLAQTSGKAMGPLIMGFLYDIQASGPFIANAVILVMGALLVWFVLRDPARETKTT
jgi:MFS transporter, DHA1 family, multidrug resistance protein